MKQLTNGATAHFSHYQRLGKHVIRMPHGFWDNGAGRVDLSRITDDPRELAHVIEYRLCEMMGQAGLSYRAIAETMGLSRGEVKQRLGRLKISVKAYRDGKTPLSQQVIAKLTEVAQKRLVENLAGLLLR